MGRAVRFPVSWILAAWLLQVVAVPPEFVVKAGVDGPDFTAELLDFHNIQGATVPPAVWSTTMRDWCHLSGDPCHNGATCTNTYFGFQCQCAPGFYGEQCGSIDECHSNPCQHGGMCRNQVNKYICDCLSGYTGTHCQSNIDECQSHPNPCENGATCHDTDGSYRCTCAHGFTGRDCETNINECLSHPCQHGSTCIDGINKFTCHCPPGYTGTRCEMDIDECRSHPCQHGGTCTDHVNEYTCDCPSGYTGTNCQTNVNECRSHPNPCKNGATCHDTDGSYTCTCRHGFTGRNCETNINECHSSPCQNGGTCHDGVSSFTCQCQVGYMGTTCQTNINECNSHTNPCNNGATCHDTDGSYTCTCRQGFTGRNCETNINDCHLNLCQNGATCIDGINTFTCSCLTGFEGPHCEVNTDDCASSPCQHGGTCMDGVSSYTCLCSLQYTGKHCETVADMCRSHPCRNGGTCESRAGGYSCRCPGDVTGQDCETIVSCLHSTTNDTDLGIRLVGGRSPAEGRVEVYHGGVWGTVCDDNFDVIDARIVCRALCLESDEIPEVTSGAQFGSDSGLSVVLDDVMCTGDEVKLDQCRHNGWGVSDCNHSEDVGVVCTHAPLIRLVNGPSAREGRVEVYGPGGWGTVCDNDFDQQDARVVCTMLGMPTSNPAVREEAYYGQGGGAILMSDVSCNGSEVTIQDCPRKQQAEQECTHQEDVGVVCSEGSTVRLVGGVSKWEGRLEVWHAGTWGTVCDDGFSSQEASVVCRMLGLYSGDPVVHHGAVYGAGSGLILLDEVQCVGTESHLAQCSHAPWGLTDCTHSEDVGLACPAARKIRLVNGSTQYEGRVEVYMGGQWGTVCDEDFDRKDALVVCRMMGVEVRDTSSVEVHGGAWFGPGSGHVLLANVECSGDERELEQCPHKAASSLHCQHDNDVGVMCGHDLSSGKLIG